MGLDLALVADNVSKTFGATRALENASLSIRGGEVHGLVGANGSGKSTLIKILTGIYVPDEGQLAIWGNEVTLPVRKPTEIGIAVVHQRLGLDDGATVVESVGTGVGYQHGRAWQVNWRTERARCRASAERLGIDIDPETRISDLPAAKRTVVGIMRALRNIHATTDRHVLILDEPTVSMSPREVALLEGVLANLTAAGDAVLLVSHRLKEVIDLCNSVTVLRDGQNQGIFDTQGLDEATLLRHMLGEDPTELSASNQGRESAPVAIQTRGLSGEQLRDISVEFHCGQITGFTGLVGSGHDEIPYLIAGSVQPRQGAIQLGDGESLPAGVRARMLKGISIVPGDRAKQALWLEGQAAENLSLPILGSFFRGGRLARSRENAHARKLMGDYTVRPLLPTAPVTNFSGGNQQKIVLAKALQTSPKVLVLHEPTVGVDANAKRQIYLMVRAAAARQTAVVVCSTDYEELAEYCDNVYVIRNGRIAKRLDGSDVTESMITAWCNSADGRSGPSDIGMELK
jgi:ribose transport system ATP-binding protein